MSASDELVERDCETIRKLVHWHCGDDCHEDERGHDTNGRIPCAFPAWERLKGHIEALTAENERLREREAEAVGLLRLACNGLEGFISVASLNGHDVPYAKQSLDRITTHLKERPDGQ